MGRRKELKKNPIDREAEAKAIEEMQTQLKEQAEARKKRIEDKNKYGLRRHEREALVGKTPKEKKAYLKTILTND